MISVQLFGSAEDRLDGPKRRPVMQP